MSRGCTGEEKKQTNKNSRDFYIIKNPLNAGGM